MCAAGVDGVQRVHACDVNEFDCGQVQHEPFATHRTVDVIEELVGVACGEFAGNTQQSPGAALVRGESGDSLLGRSDDR